MDQNNTKIGNAPIGETIKKSWDLKRPFSQNPRLSTPQTPLKDSKPPFFSFSASSTASSSSLDFKPSPDRESSDGKQISDLEMFKLSNPLENAHFDKKSNLADKFKTPLPPTPKSQHSSPKLHFKSTPQSSISSNNSNNSSPQLTPSSTPSSIISSSHFVTPEFSSIIGNLQSYAQFLSGEVEHWKNEYETAMIDVDKFVAMSENRAAQLKQNEIRIKSLEEMLSEARKNLDSSRQIVSSIDGKLVQIVALTESKSSEFESLRQDIQSKDELEKTICELKEVTKDLELQIANLKSEKQLMEEHWKEKYSLIKKELEEKAEVYHVNISKLENELSDMKQRSNDFEAENKQRLECQNESQVSLAEANAEKDKLESVIKVNQDEILHLRRSLDCYQNHWNEMEQKVASVQHLLENRDDLNSFLPAVDEKLKNFFCEIKTHLETSAETQSHGLKKIFNLDDFGENIKECMKLDMSGLRDILDGNSDFLQRSLKDLPSIKDLNGKLTETNAFLKEHFEKNNNVSPLIIEKINGVLQNMVNVETFNSTLKQFSESIIIAVSSSQSNRNISPGNECTIAPEETSALKSEIRSLQQKLAISEEEHENQIKKMKDDHTKNIVGWTELSRKHQSIIDGLTAEKQRLQIDLNKLNQGQEKDSNATINETVSPVSVSTEAKITTKPAKRVSFTKVENDPEFDDIYKIAEKDLKSGEGVSHANTRSNVSGRTYQKRRVGHDASDGIMKRHNRLKK